MIVCFGKALNRFYETPDQQPILLEQEGGVHRCSVNKNYLDLQDCINPLREIGEGKAENRRMCSLVHDASLYKLPTKSPRVFVFVLEH